MQEKRKLFKIYQFSRMNTNSKLCLRLGTIYGLVLLNVHKEKTSNYEQFIDMVAVKYHFIKDDKNYDGDL